MSTPIYHYPGLIKFRFDIDVVNSELTFQILEQAEFTRESGADYNCSVTDLWVKSRSSPDVLPGGLFLRGRNRGRDTDVITFLYDGIHITFIDDLLFTINAWANQLGFSKSGERLRHKQLSLWDET